MDKDSATSFCPCSGNDATWSSDMTQRRTLVAAIWAIAAALGALQASLPAEEATSRRSDSVRIGMVDSLFREWVARRTF